MLEEKRNIKLVALDMDGTLLNDSFEISSYTKTIISQAVENGVHVVLSTGRWFDACNPYAEILNLNSYLITVNGGEIWTPSKELLQNSLLKTADIEKMWNLGKNIGIKMWMVSTTDIFYADRPKDLYKYEWLKFGCDSKDEIKLNEMKNELLTFENLEVSNSLPTNIEVNPQNVNKATALQRVCNKIGITMDEVMAVGDSLNDLEMIKQVGIGVAVGNAQMAIKEAADYETETNNNDGVAKAIKRFVL